METVSLIGGVKDDGMFPSVLVPSGSNWEPQPRCSYCFYDTYARPDEYYVEGFDDLRHPAFSRQMFFPGMMPLTGYLKEIEDLAKRLSGVEVVRVGYRYWNQEPLLRERWFEVEPRLGALFVAKVIDSACWKNGELLPRCPDCGRICLDWEDLPIDSENLLLSEDGLPAEDLFLLEGGTQSLGVFLKESGKAKMVEAGWRVNLELLPVAVGSC